MIIVIEPLTGRAGDEQTSEACSPEGAITRYVDFFSSGKKAARRPG
jgi:hypothetical protein